MAASSESLNSTSSCCFILIYGIPGSGKTHLSRQLLARAGALTSEGSSEGVNWNWVHVCMDDYYPTDTRQNEQVNSPITDSDFDWKQMRHQVTTHIEDYLNNKPSPITTNTNSELSLKDDKRGKRTVLIIDDNLPLTSMRYEYYQLARKYGCGFLSIYLYCQLEVALYRNSQRFKPIPSQTIVDMFSMIEKPKENWETNNCITLDSSSYEDWSTDACVDIISKCSNALQNPIPPIAEIDIAKIQAAQRQTSESVLHTADQILRQLVSSEINSFHGGKEEKKQVAAKANKTRKIILDELRHDKLNDLPIDKLEEHLKIKYHHTLYDS